MTNKAPTQKQIKARAKELGVKARWSAEWQEWTINGGYMTDPQEAMDTLEWLASNPAQIAR